jgi:methyl-accepting chemotaxis protein
MLLLIAAVFAASVYFKHQSLYSEATKHAEKTLQMTLKMRSSQLQSLVQTMRSEIRFWAESDQLREGMQAMVTAWGELGAQSPDGKAATLARQLYIKDNPYYPNYMRDYKKAADGSAYSDIHEKIHALLSGLTDHRSYYDVFLFNKEGDAIYTVYKEDDYATNFIHGKYKDTSLAKGVQEVLHHTNLNHVALQDFIPYAPSNDVPASFIETILTDKKNRTLGVLAFQLPIDPIDKIMRNVSGLGKGVELLLVGQDHTLRNNSVLNKTMKALSAKLQSKAIDEGLDGKRGVIRTKDYRNIETLTAYAPLEFSGNNWVLIAKQDVDAIYSPVEKAFKQWLISISLLTILSLFLAWLLTRRKDDVSTTEDESG